MGEKVRVVACHNEPGDIIWENQHINWPSRILRRLIQAILLLILILFTFCAISALNIATPSTSTNLDTNNYNANSIISVKNATILYVWCIENKSMMTSLTSINTLCTPYITRYYWSLAIGILITFVIVGVKTFLKKIVVFLARFQRYKEQTEQSIGIIRNLFYTYICTTVLITFLVNIRLLSCKPTSSTYHSKSLLAISSQINTYYRMLHFYNNIQILLLFGTLISDIR